MVLPATATCEPSNDPVSLALPPAGAESCARAKSASEQPSVAAHDADEITFKNSRRSTASPLFFATCAGKKVLKSTPGRSAFIRFKLLAYIGTSSTATGSLTRPLSLHRPFELLLPSSISRPVRPD